MKKIAKIAIIEIINVLLIIAIIGCYNLVENYNEYKNDKELNNIKITMSNKIEKADMDKYSDELQSLCNTYPYKDYYDFYYCIVKVENNSKFYIYDVSFHEGTNGDKWILDYESDGSDNCYIKPNSTEYVALPVSVDKTISEEELKSIPEELPKSVDISADKESDSNKLMDYYFYRQPVQCELTDEDYSTNEFVFSLGFI
ncbi:MAG: hypothetical protein IJ851_06800 [Eubacterium sp.]|nr:hypothetical protein [Eubacterium sp.]